MVAVRFKYPCSLDGKSRGSQPSNLSVFLVSGVSSSMVWGQCSMPVSPSTPPSQASWFPQPEPSFSLQKPKKHTRFQGHSELHSPPRDKTWMSDPHAPGSHSESSIEI